MSKYALPRAIASFHAASGATAASRCRTGRGDSLHAVLLFCSRNHDALRAQELREVVGSETNSALRQVEPEPSPHGPIEPGMDLRLRRPNAFVHSADQHALAVQKARFERTKNADAGILLERRPHRLGRERSGKLSA